MMQQIADMQKKFFEEHKDELELIEKAKTERQSVYSHTCCSLHVDTCRGSVASQTGSALLCAVGMSTVQSHEREMATCILCQETGDVSEDKSFVLSVSVQRSSVLRRVDQELANGEK